MGRTPCCDKNGLKKGPWTTEEDQRLIDYIQKHGSGNWRTLPKNAGIFPSFLLFKPYTTPGAIFDPFSSFVKELLISKFKKNLKLLKCRSTSW